MQFELDYSPLSHDQSMVVGGWGLWQFWKPGNSVDIPTWPLSARLQRLELVKQTPSKQLPGTFLLWLTSSKGTASDLL